MFSLKRGRFVARLAESSADVLAAQRLRHLAFRTVRGLQGSGAGLDADAFDALCQHMLVEEARTGTLVCCCRLLPLQGGAEIGRSYSAQHYNLDRLADFSGPMMELGRFCIHPEWKDPDIMRVAWGAMTQLVDAQRVDFLFGCSSFDGAETSAHAEAFAMLKDRHLAPQRWLPRVKAPNVFRFARALRGRKPDQKRAMLGMPPLLRTYLMMGGWVSDHAVVDRDMNTLHVFTGLEIRTIPPARARLLRAVAG